MLLLEGHSHQYKDSCGLGSNFYGPGGGAVKHARTCLPS